MAPRSFRSGSKCADGEACDRQSSESNKEDQELEKCSRVQICSLSFREMTKQRLELNRRRQTDSGGREKKLSTMGPIGWPSACYLTLFRAQIILLVILGVEQSEANQARFANRQQLEFAIQALANQQPTDRSALRTAGSQKPILKHQVNSNILHDLEQQYGQDANRILAMSATSPISTKQSDPSATQRASIEPKKQQAESSRSNEMPAMKLRGQPKSESLSSRRKEESGRSLEARNRDKKSGETSQHEQTERETEQNSDDSIGFEVNPNARLSNKVSLTREVPLNFHQTNERYPEQDVSWLGENFPRHFGESPPIRSRQEHYLPRTADHPNEPNRADFADVPTLKGHSPNIKVVFNNNPQFIIGKEPENLLQRKTRQPGSNIYNEDYNSDESSLSESRIMASKTIPPDQQVSDELPCTKDKTSQSKSFHAPNIEHINLTNQDHQNSFSSPSPLQQQQQQQQQEQEKVSPPPSSPPPPPEPQVKVADTPASIPKAVVAQQDVGQIPEQAFKGQQLDEQVIVPLEQMVKSGIRPPLRMVISMRNKNGDVMRMPINLHGSIRTKQPLPTLELGPQMQIQFETPEISSKKQQQIDESTPLGGDFFDPSIVKPFRTKSKVHEKTNINEQAQIQLPVQEAKIDRPPVPEVVVPTKQVDHPLEGKERVEQQQAEVPQTKEKVQAVSRVRMETKEVPVERSDCAEKQSKVAVIGQNPDGDLQQQIKVAPTVMGASHLVPQNPTKFDNKTLAMMFAQLHEAFNQQVTGQHAATTSQEKGPPAALAREPQPHLQPPIQQQQQQRQSQQQHQDDQEDLMVAMLAANMTEHGAGQSGRQMSMTVIRPPKGTTLQEAIRIHAKQSPDPTRTVAILQSIKPSRVGSSDVGPAAPKAAPDFAHRPESQPIGVDVHPRRPEGSAAMQPPADGPNEPDTDGFSSGSDISLDLRQQRTAFTELRASPLFRFKRFASQNSVAGLLEASDKLTLQAKTRDKLNQLAFQQRARKMAEKDGLKLESDGNRSNKSLSERDAKKEAGVVVKRQRAVDKKFGELAQVRGSGDSILAAASESSQLNEVPDDDEPEEESDGPDNEEASSAPMGSESDAEDESNDMGDEADDSSGFDSDDEPYNQGASSERDYNSPSFEIPQIDINPDTLKQRGCKTVLREVQEIPMNGLGVLQANGQAGSGYEPAGASGGQAAGVRVKRQADNSNLINSRKVTSIVMTKECHFPNDSSQREGLQQGAISKLNQQQVVPQVTLESATQAIGKVAPYRPQELVHAKSQFAPPNEFEQVNTKPVITYFNPSQQAVSMGRVSGPPPGQHYMLARKPDLHSLALLASSQQGRQPNVIKRRSVEASPSSQVARPLAKPAAEIHLGADSRRNEVVAQKLYKPPSADDPYHTLSYSSKNGVDPDPDYDDEDESSMEAEERPQRKASASNRQRMRESLSPSERKALTDPNYDDTDPIAPGAQNERDSPRADSEPDVDENDGDLMEESRADKGRETVVAPLLGGGGGGSGPALRVHDLVAGKLGRHQREPASMASAPAGRRYDGQTNAAGHWQPRAELRSQPARQSQADAPRFGKSFRFEHEVGRPESAGLMGQLKGLKAGATQGFVAVRGDREPLAMGASGNRAPKLRIGSALRGPIARREDADDEADEQEDADEEEQQQPVGRRQAASELNEDEDPDADPEYNPKESHLPAHTKPKRVQKSFAYVHRDLPRKGSRNPDDFVVSYGRGNLQTEQEDYDSDRENNPQMNNEHQRERGAASTARVSRLALQSEPAGGLSPPMELKASIGRPMREKEEASFHHPFSRTQAQPDLSKQQLLQLGAAAHRFG